MDEPLVGAIALVTELVAGRAESWDRDRLLPQEVLRMAASTVARLGNNEQQTRYLPVVLDGHKVWVTAAHYADLIMVLGRYRDGAAAVVVVPATTPEVRVERITDPLGCRAAGHADVHLDSVRLPTDSVLGGGGQSLSLLVTLVLAYGRISVAWGCVGILRACHTAAASHAARHVIAQAPP